jgi:TonB family protein
MIRIYLFIISSILIHLLFFEGASLIPIVSKPSTTPIEVSLISPENPELDKPSDAINKSLTIVRETPVPKENLDLSEEAKKQKAHYLSAEDRRVRVETRAQLLGLTKNRFYQAQKETEKKKQSQEKKSEKSKEQHKWKSYDNSEFLANESNKTKKMNNAETQSSSQEFSTVGEILSDNIKIGDMTALNTDRSLYYSFYSRIEELIRYRWETLIEEALLHVNPARINSAKENWDTRIDIFLNADGSFAKALVLKSSGVNSFDFAASRAFEEAKLFPHPPPEMVENGVIRLQYMFRVFYKPKVMVNQSGRHTEG